MSSPEGVRFFIYRYALVPFDQVDLLPPDLPKPKGRVVEPFLPLGDRPTRLFTYWARDYALTGFEAVDSEEVPGRFLVGRLVKHRTTRLGRLTSEDVVEIEADDWIPVWVVFDTVRQYVAVEAYSQFGQHSQHYMSVLDRAFSREVEERFAHNFVVSPVSNPRRFWEVIEEFPFVFSVRLDLVSPNFLDANRNVRETLESWREVLNQTKTSITLANEQGELKADPAALEDAIEYASEGEGGWKATVAESRDGKKRTFSGKREVEEMNVPTHRASALQGEDEERAVGRRASAKALVETFKEWIGAR